ncbi:TetR family transcriptional regulator [Prosthecobacter fusiformis]|uniref:TetR family transcriptional regulator n=1 Tax=Prosthecobacter fusiformis TaxID=48464 RepID=A0A4R7S3X8_9BACT|nr:TetR/AcrR family transcriptional regulator [Prosthecobacter fusiformis]TDU73004.1 TetR family transcriptional regulator [Prosthecobacter fusiformis]
MDESLKKQPRLGARERIVETALKLFYRDGLRATGIDKVIAESGVAKMSLYRHFPSKSLLVAECLRLRSQSWISWFQPAVEKKLRMPGAGLEVIADVLRTWFAKADFRGCPFINAQAETPASDEDVLEVIREHKRVLESWLVELAIRLEYATPKQTAAAVMIVMDGMMVRAQMTRDATVNDAGHVLLKKFSRHVHRDELQEEGEAAQLYLPGL